MLTHFLCPAPLRVLSLTALACSWMGGCGFMLGLDDYDFGTPCEKGHKLCACLDNGECNGGLECRTPGLCVDPAETRDAGDISADAASRD